MTSDQDGLAAPPQTPAGQPAPEALSHLYQDLILDHHRHPRHRGVLAEPTAEAHVANRICGDAVSVALQVKNCVIVAVRFRGEGCAISQATASMMAELVEGKRLVDAQTIVVQFTQLMHGDDRAAQDPALGDLRALASVARFPARLRCVLLPFEGLEEAMAQAR